MPDVQLRIELVDTRPLIWRRVIVPQHINLYTLHAVIQATMGWEDIHLYEFECNGRYYGEIDDLSDRPVAQARNAKLYSMLPRLPDGEFRYVYDFGDGWEHRILIEKSGLPETNPCPRWLEGAMACPPEDIGGLIGYEALKEAIAGRGDEYGQTLLSAVGQGYDPYTLPAEEIADRLAPIQRRFHRP
ncbi:pRiA4b ORF-3-like protein [Modicisalibacter xianhensis]|uniref:PRiA4b ORF-3-like protein n=1 Tax=Modicisalibacter xianhensis TaxID=442341 RepID=A0A4R8G9F7_9GAMM|nr:plasmid pRiA4b ORF-3 family protein [Halomonas xianhensis]TDX32142.1 pRiA4b ORF-3-like protein [Halomonas xianhensis]